MQGGSSVQTIYVKVTQPAPTSCHGANIGIVLIGPPPTEHGLIRTTAL